MDVKIQKKIVISLMMQNQESLREIPFLFNLHSQVKFCMNPRKFKRVVASFPQYQLLGGLEGKGSAKTILDCNLSSILIPDYNSEPCIFIRTGYYMTFLMDGRQLLVFDVFYLSNF